MRAYLATTSAVFGLMVVAHIFRVAAEGPHLLTEPIFIVLTLAAAGLCGWGLLLLRRRS